MEEIELFSGHSINYDLPLNFRENDRSLFYEENFVNEIPAVNMHVLKNIVATNGVLIKQYGVIDQYTHHTFLSVDKKVKAVFKKMFTSTIKIDEFINGFQDWGDNYFHWITELLPRIHAIHILKPDIPVLIAKKLSKLPFVEISLKQLQIQFIPLNSGSCITAKRVYASKVPHVGRFNELLLTKLRDSILQSFSLLNSKVPFRKIYISRNQARRRKISNENELWKIIQIFGFERLELEDISWSDQVKIFSEASVVVASHGAGLTNIMFMHAGTHVIELKSSNNNYWCYFSMARVFGLEYSYLLCKGDTEDHRNADIEVNMEILMELFAKIGIKNQSNWHTSNSGNASIQY